MEVVYDGQTYCLWDGFHRLMSARKAGLTVLDANVQPGDLTYARLLFPSANKTHGLRLTTKDKEARVKKALQHPFSAGKSDRAIAEHCGIFPQMVTCIWRELVATGKLSN